MADDRFVYVTFIRTTPEKLWDALTQPEFTRCYWCETHQESAWTKGAEWRLCAPDGRVADSGEIVEIDWPRRLVVTWQHQLRDDLRAEGHSRATFELEEVEGATKLTVTHEIGVSPSKLIAGVAGGWPPILASLKSLLETGEALEVARHWPKGY